jgi:anti-anti-sigma factor
MNNLEINREDCDGEIVLKCSGRLDANQAGHLNDYIDRLVREGLYQISLDLTGIEYLSSAGIRSLVTQYKNLKAINGQFHIAAMSENVKQVLNMVGMVEMLGQQPKKVVVEEKKHETSNQLTLNGFKFKLSALQQEGTTKATFYGEPEQIKESRFKPKDARQINSEEKHFAIGLGAIGNSFDECKNRFGEYIMMGKNIAYLPADGSKKPDYMVSSGQLIASITELYGIHFQGNFSHLVYFEPEDLKNTIGLSQIAESIQKMTNFKQMAVVMVAESGGLIGTSLNTSPVDGKKIFSFPEVKETMNFTTEPAHFKMLTLSVGCFSAEENGRSKFLRPLLGDSPLSAHVHTAVFPYTPLKKTGIDLNETVEYLFETSELTDILHLVNDNREISGQGESQFVQGFCWIVPIESINNISSK